MTAATQIPVEPRALDLIAIFDRCFSGPYNTRLEAGAGEPVYLPAGSDCRWHRVVFAHGYAASALHEIAHWCIAGSRRRELEDYGYWYRPDGRSAREQAEFEEVEVRPQALEWIFADAAGMSFRVSVDNLSGAAVDRRAFEAAVAAAAAGWCERGLPARAACFQRALAAHFRTGARLDVARFEQPGAA